MKRFIKTRFERKQLTDSSLALILLCLLIFLWKGIKPALYFALVTSILSMLHSSIMYPWAVIWYTLTELLGTLGSKVLLSIIYLLIVWPVGFIRQLSGKDNLQLRDFKKSSKSVFRIRDIKYSGKDLETPY